MTVLWLVLGVMGACALSAVVYGPIFWAMHRLSSDLDPEEKARRRRILFTRAIPLVAMVFAVLGAGAFVGASLLGGDDGWLVGVIVTAVGFMALLLIALVVTMIILGVQGER